MSPRLDRVFLGYICLMMVGFGFCLLGSKALDWCLGAA